MILLQSLINIAGQYYVSFLQTIHVSALKYKITVSPHTYWEQTTACDWDWPGISCLLEGLLTTTYEVNQGRNTVGVDPTTPNKQVWWHLHIVLASSAALTCHYFRGFSHLTALEQFFQRLQFFLSQSYWMWNSLKSGEFTPLVFCTKR